MNISFCMIAFNEATTITANLAHLYPHAHEIIVCEGSVAPLRRHAGVGLRSDDGTVELLKQFPDPEGKLHIIQAPWQDKNEMATAYARCATGDLIWHVDADEFYDVHSFAAVPREFDDPDLTALTIPMHVFWKSPDFLLVDESGDDCWFNYVRVLRRREAMSVLHLPIRRIIDGEAEQSGVRPPRDPRIRAWHYAWNGNDRVALKMLLYANRDASTTKQDWLMNVWNQWRPTDSDPQWPRGVHPSTLWKLWPRRFNGAHPECVKNLLPAFDLLTNEKASV